MADVHNVEVGKIVSARRKLANVGSKVDRPLNRLKLPNRDPGGYSRDVADAS